MIEARKLSKWYGPTQAIEDVSFTVERGKIAGFLGPNGAGKSTTLRILTGFLPPTEGSCSIAGHDVLGNSLNARAMIGYLPERNPLYMEMRAEEYLAFRAAGLQMESQSRQYRIDEVIELCDLKPVRRRLIQAMSKGNRQRLGLAAALLHKPEVLILDEPSSGLDPSQMLLFRTLLDRLRERHTILLSTHLLAEVERLADQIILIAGGRIVADGTLTTLAQQTGEREQLTLEAQGTQETLMKLIHEKHPNLHPTHVEQSDGWCRLRFTAPASQSMRESIGRILMSQKIPLRELTTQKAGLEQLFTLLIEKQHHAQTSTTKTQP